MSTETIAAAATRMSGYRPAATAARTAQPRAGASEHLRRRRETRGLRTQDTATQQLELLRGSTSLSESIDRCKQSCKPCQPQRNVRHVSCDLEPKGGPRDPSGDGYRGRRVSRFALRLEYQLRAEADRLQQSTEDVALCVLEGQPRQRASGKRIGEWRAIALIHHEAIPIDECRSQVVSRAGRNAKESKEPRRCLGSTNLKMIESQKTFAARGYEFGQLIKLFVGVLVHKLPEPVNDAAC